MLLWTTLNVSRSLTMSSKPFLESELVREWILEYTKRITSGEADKHCAEGFLRQSIDLRAHREFSWCTVLRKGWTLFASPFGIALKKVCGLIFVYQFYLLPLKRLKPIDGWREEKGMIDYKEQWMKQGLVKMHMGCIHVTSNNHITKINMFEISWELYIWHIDNIVFIKEYVNYVYLIVKLI